jgi:hypothetical protein
MDRAAGLFAVAPIVVVAEIVVSRVAALTVDAPIERTLDLVIAL